MLKSFSRKGEGLRAATDPMSKVWISSVMFEEEQEVAEDKEKNQ